MTAAALRTALLARISSLLGSYSYKRSNGTTVTVPAIWMGEPPSNYTASGVEVRIGTDAELSATPLLNNEHSLHGTLTVRVVGWGGASLTEAVQRILSAYPLASVAYIPASESLGIINQAVIRIPTA